MKYLLILPLMLLLSACGPKVETTYIAPLDAAGKSCVKECVRVAERCNLYEELRIRDCVADRYFYSSRADRGLWRYHDDHHTWRYHPRYGAADLWRSDARFYCESRRGDFCEVMYDRCFESCGGTIRKEVIDPDTGKVIESSETSPKANATSQTPMGDPLDQ